MMKVGASKELVNWPTNVCLLSYLLVASCYPFEPSCSKLVYVLRKCNFENKICMTDSDMKTCVPIFVYHILEFKLLSC